MEGDFLTTAIPPGHDVVVVANVIHTLSPEQIAQMLSNLRRAAAPRARLLLVDLLTDSNHAEPVIAALMAGEFLVLSGEGDVYSEQEVSEWLRGAGWEVKECKPLTGPTSLMVAEAAG